jgi:two-component system, OmpR family, response regulator
MVRSDRPPRLPKIANLVQRLRSLFRRHNCGHAISERELISGSFTFDGWQLDLRTRLLLNPEGAEVSLTKGEYALLLAFLAAPGRSLRP